MLRETYLSGQEVVHACACNVIAFLCGRGHQVFVTEAVPLGELLHEEALFGLTGERCEYPDYSCLDLPLRHISSSLGVARPFTKTRVIARTNTLYTARLRVQYTQSPLIRTPWDQGLPVSQICP